MGPLGMPELIVIFVIALLVFGPRKLPELGRSLGKSLGEFKRASNELRNTLEEEVRVEEQREAHEARRRRRRPTRRPARAPSSRRSVAVESPVIDEAPARRGRTRPRAGATAD